MNDFVIAREYRPVALLETFERVSARLDAHADSTLKEVQTLFFLACFASVEGLLRHDMQERLKGTESDPVTAKLAALRDKARSRHVTLDEILEVW